MIPKDYITAWRAQAPWRLDAQVEQDLVISRAIVDLFSVPEVAGSLVFRGEGRKAATSSTSGSLWIRDASIQRLSSPASSAT